eukprot:6180816-Pleurochrysis_carterae.AAC.4
MFGQAFELSRFLARSAHRSYASSRHSTHPGRRTAKMTDPCLPMSDEATIGVSTARIAPLVTCMGFRRSCERETALTAAMLAASDANLMLLAARFLNLI